MAYIFSVIIYKSAMQIGLNRISVKLLSFPDRMVIIGMHVFYADRKIFIRVINHKIRIFSYRNRTLILAAEDFRYICRTYLYDPLIGQFSVIGSRKHVRIEILNTGTAIRNLGEIIFVMTYYNLANRENNGL